ncbi:MAG: hypothetical protein JWQ09_1215 [Segetibacter sp.]|nr:hypothetical protein [Segetibacter sp.]
MSDTTMFNAYSKAKYIKKQKAVPLLKLPLNLNVLQFSLPIDYSMLLSQVSHSSLCEKERRSNLITKSTNFQSKEQIASFLAMTNRL